MRGAPALVGSRDESAEAGKPIPGQKAPYGYRWADPAAKTRLVEHPVKADVVRRIFRETAHGKSLRRVAADLSDDSIPSPSGRGHWVRTTLHAILGLPTYAGEPRAYRPSGRGDGTAVG